MVNYILNTWSNIWQHSRRDNAIYIGNRGLNLLTDNERSDYIADTITHEYMHELMHELFNSVVSTLFETVEKHFRNMTLVEKTITEKQNVMTHTAFIKQYGIKAFLVKHEIDEKQFEKATILCNWRNIYDRLQ